MKLKQMKLTKYERRLEQELLRGEWVPVSKPKFNEIARALARRDSGFRGQDIAIGLKYATKSQGGEMVKAVPEGFH